MSNLNSMRIALAQINTTVGDLQGNRDKILNGLHQAADLKCDLLAFPELCVTGYPPEDLLLRNQFIRDQKKVLNDIAASVKNITCIVGYVDKVKGKLYNSAALLHSGQIVSTYHKTNLPNYSVFDEERYFKKGKAPLIVTINGIKTGISICEDIWVSDSVVETQALCGQAEILLNISASPYYLGKPKEREALMLSKAKRFKSFIAYLNLIGGQDELVFDGNSIIFSPEGELLARGKSFEEDFIVLDIKPNNIKELRQNSQEYQNDVNTFDKPVGRLKTFNIETVHIKKPSLVSSPVKPFEIPEAKVYKALVLGLRDYVFKNGFSKVTFGLSGGVDSALVAAIAADALGKENVIAVSMPSQFSSQGSKDDAKKLADNFGIEYLTLPIKDVFKVYEKLLEPTFKDRPFDITEENLQARIRGNLLMALSNKFGYIVLATGNKSEVSVGYSTLYGDSVGGFAPLKDVLKMMVYKLCEYRNSIAGYDIIPNEILEKAPSAELRPDQKDQDSLPEYDILDQILEYYVEHEMGVTEIVEKGFDQQTVKKVAQLVDVNEYKRRQAAPGVKITPRAFGKDRRMPITNKYRAR